MTTLGKILVIGDMHFKPTIALLNDLFVEKIMEMIQELRPEKVIFLGDTLDSHSEIKLDMLGKAIELFDKINSLGMKQYIIIGNHDMKNNQEFMPKRNAFMALSKWPNTKVISAEILIEGGYAFVPYLPKNTFSQTLKRYDLGNVHTIFCHQEFRGAQMGAIKSDAEEWTGKQTLISGHIHDYQTLKVGGETKVIYVGTPYTITYGSNEKKYVMIFDGDGWRTKRTNLPCLRTEKLDAKSLLTYTIEKANIPFTKIKLAITQQQLNNPAIYRKISELEVLGVKLERHIMRDKMEIELQALEHIPERNITDELYEHISENYPELKNTLAEVLGV